MHCQVFANCSLPLETTSNGTDQGSPVVPLVSYYIYTIFKYVNGHFLSNTLGLFGILSNTANLVVYKRMGMSETTNIELFALSLVDLIVCVCFVEMNTVFILSDLRLASGALLQETTAVVMGLVYPALGCGAIITAMIATGRCLCIVVPLKAKKILTPKKTWLLIIAAALYELVFMVLIVAMTSLPYGKNRSIRPIFLVCSFTAPSLASFFIVCIATIFLITRLRHTLKWRKGAVSRSMDHTTRDMRVCRRAVIICIIFIVCFFPSALAFVSVLAFPRLSIMDPYFGWLTYTLFTFTNLFQAVSSSVNIFVYYSMSSKFRTMFKALFVRGISAEI